jgi:hypothetical protein
MLELTSCQLLLTVNLTQILKKEEKNFCFEGLRRMDLLRNNLPERSATMDNCKISANN